MHWAHRVAASFTDGQLYVNLRGFDASGAPLSPSHAIRGFLDALGVPPSGVPLDLDAQISLYRSLLAGQRMLVVLDNARDAEQVRPLLPGSSTNGVVVTSRAQLTSLVAVEGASPVALDMPTADEARELLCCRLGAQRAAAEPQVVSEIIARCARLPLALVIVAARAAARPWIPLTMFVEELRDADGLDAFDGGDSAANVRAVFSWSYRGLGAKAAELFRMLGRHAGPDIALPAVASLLGAPPNQTRLVLEEMTRAHLIIEHKPDRYTFHDLLRAYAAELADAVDHDDKQRAAVRRLLDHYLHAAHSAAALLEPHREAITIKPAVPGVAAVPLAAFDEAHAWLTAEHRVLVQLIERAAAVPADPGRKPGAVPANSVRELPELGGDTYPWQLAWTLTAFFHRQGQWHDQAAMLRTALAAAQRRGDALGQAYSHLALGRAYTRLGCYDDAHAGLVAALELFGARDHRLELARTRGALAYIHTLRGDYQQALLQLQISVQLFRTAGQRQGEAQALNDLGWNHAKLGDYHQALIHCQHAIAVLEALGDRHGQASTWDSLGYIHHHLGHRQKAVGCYRRALALFGQVDEHYLQADTLIHLGEHHYAHGYHGATRAAWQEALEILTELHHPSVDELRNRLARLDG